MPKKKLTPKQWHKKVSAEAHYEAFDALCDYIRYQHNEFGLSIPQLAVDSDVTAQTLYNWINFRVLFPHFRTVAKVARGLGLRSTFIDDINGIDIVEHFGTNILKDAA